MPKAKAKPEGVVYALVEIPLNGGPPRYVKVGQAKTFALAVNRHINCQCGNPRRLLMYILKRTEDAKVEEGRIHRRYHELWVSGEWFRLEGALLRAVSNARTLHQAKKGEPYYVGSVLRDGPTYPDLAALAKAA